MLITDDVISKMKETHMSTISLDGMKKTHDFVKRFGDFLSIILNPQKKKIVCFSGKDCVQSKLILLSK